MGWWAKKSPKPLQILALALFTLTPSLSYKNKQKLAKKALWVGSARVLGWAGEWDRQPIHFSIKIEAILSILDLQTKFHISWREIGGSWVS